MKKIFKTEYYNEKTDFLNKINKKTENPKTKSYVKKQKSLE
jgi:hypothetical protein